MNGYKVRSYSKHKNKKISAIAGAFILGILGAVFLAAPVRADAPGSLQTMMYDVYAGGIHAVEAQMDVDLSKKGRYSMVFGAATRGFLAKLAPWQGSFESTGWKLADNDLRPERHESSAIWRGEGETKTYRYSKDRKFLGLSVKDHQDAVHKEEIDDELTQGTTDALSATLMVMQAVAQGQPCAGESEIFDGDRRFKLVFRDQGNTQLEPSKYNTYKGEAQECTVEVVPIVGRWHKKPRGWLSIQEQGRALGTMPTVWLANMPGANGPAVPVKVRVKTEYGTLFMHLAEYRGAGEVKVAEKRAGK